jgi:outer membrane lipoprotein SlyB
MSVREKAQGVLGGAFAERLGGERPGPLRAAAGAAVAGGITGVVVFRLLRQTEDSG